MFREICQKRNMDPSINCGKFCTIRTKFNLLKNIQNVFSNKIYQMKHLIVQDFFSPPVLINCVISKGAYTYVVSFPQYNP